MPTNASVLLLNLTEWMDDEIKAHQEGDDSFSATITRLIEKLHANRKNITADFVIEFNEFEILQRFADKRRNASYYVYEDTLEKIREIGEHIETVGKVRYLKQRKDSYNLQLIIRMALYWNNPPQK